MLSRMGIHLSRWTLSGSVMCMGEELSPMVDEMFRLARLYQLEPMDRDNPNGFSSSFQKVGTT